MRKPTIKNKYSIKPKDIQKARILNRDKIHQSPFWRNDSEQAWCLSGGAGKGMYDSIDSYWIGFYDEDAKSHAGRIILHCSSHEGMCNYNFNKFFNYDDIETETDLELQEKLLERLNWLIDEGIVDISSETGASSKKQNTRHAARTI